MDTPLPWCARRLCPEAAELRSDLKEEATSDSLIDAIDADEHREGVLGLWHDADFSETDWDFRETT